MMTLIGMLDSPYVRRVAVSLLVMGVPFRHRSISVFRGLEAFRAINPVVKAPTLVCDDGTVLMDSTLILEYADALPGARGLTPAEAGARARALRVVGLALAACEKSVQIIYERSLRPPEKRHQPWVDRVTWQLLAAYAALEAEVSALAPAGVPAVLDQAAITAAVGWHFTQQTLPEVVAAGDHPALAALSAHAEALPPFRAAPYGDGTVTDLEA